VTELYLKEFEAFAGNGGAEGPEWVRALRRTAIDRFARVGFPSAKEEDWRFTNIQPLVQRAFRRPATGGRVSPEELAPFLFGHAEWITLVFVNGRYAPELSVGPADRLPAGVEVGSLADALARDPAALERHLTRHVGVDASPFVALNTAFLKDGAFIHVPANTALETPIHVVFVADRDAADVVAFPRNLYVLERSAQATIVESYVALTEATYFTNAVTEIALGENAVLHHDRIQQESEQAYHIAATHARQLRDSRYVSFSLMAGGAISRHNLTAHLDAPHCEVVLNGLYLARGEQLVDNHTAVYHDHPDCRSWEVYKGVLDGASHAVFNGKVFVKPEAQKTDGKQTNRNLLLSDRARVDTKPQLEIFADDVKCTHGATVGALDELPLFYLKSRGIGGDLARKLLTYAFAAEVLGEIRLQPVKQSLEALMMARLGTGA